MEFLLEGFEDLSREFNATAQYYSDFHKEVHGMRPRGMALVASEYADGDALAEAKSHLDRLIDGLNDYLEAMMSTPAGRAQLRAEGWSISEGGANDSLSD